MTEVYRNPVTGLTEAQNERLTHLAQECSEVIKAVTKIQLHGYMSHDPSKDPRPNNEDDLKTELGQMIMAVTRLNLHDDLGFSIRDAVRSSLQLYEKKKQYFHFQVD